jgi:hypothetical protein
LANGPDLPYNPSLDEFSPILSNVDDGDSFDPTTTRFHLPNFDHLHQVLVSGRGSPMSLAILNYIAIMRVRNLPSHANSERLPWMSKARVLEILEGIHEANRLFGERDIKLGFVEDFEIMHDTAVPIDTNPIERRIAETAHAFRTQNQQGNQQTPQPLRLPNVLQNASTPAPVPSIHQHRDDQDDELLTGDEENSDSSSSCTANSV